MIVSGRKFRKVGARNGERKIFIRRILGRRIGELPETMWAYT
jgi:hypothetical protein